MKTKIASAANRNKKALAVEVPAADDQLIGPRTRERFISTRECAELDTVGISMTGISEVADEFRFARIAPSFSQVLLTMEGVGEVLLDGVWRPLGPEEAFVTPAGISHAYRAIPGRSWKIAWVHYGQQAISFSRCNVAKADESFLPKTIQGLLAEIAEGGLPSAKFCWARLIDIAARRLIGPLAAGGNMSDVWTTVASDLERPWSLRKLADCAGVSPETFRRQCQTQIGRPPMHQVARMRMQMAAELLADTDLKIEIIAERVGYRSYFAFSTAFKRETGISPARYRTKGRR